MKQATIDQIVGILEQCIDGTISRVKNRISFMPFHESLLTKEIIAASSFERSFSTSFGQGPIEEISKIVAIANGAEAERQKVTMVNVNKGAVDEIGRILESLRAGIATPNWRNELERILAFEKGDYVVIKVISDLWYKIGNDETFISIKTVKPNLDQAEIAKKSMLHLKAHNKDHQTFFGLYYNPGGPERRDYNWTMPSKIFDMINDPCVLIGQDYWDHIGGKGTYISLIQIFKEVGKNTKKKLKEL